MAKELTYLTKKFPQQRLVVKPGKQTRDAATGDPVKIDGVYIQFVNGKYTTDDPEMQEYMKKYMDANQNEISIIDPEELKYQQEVMEEAKKLVDQRRKLRGSDSFGKAVESEDLDEIKKINDENQKKIKELEDKHKKEIQKLEDKIEKEKIKAQQEIDKANSENEDSISKLKSKNISKKDLMNLAKEYNVELTSAEQKDFNLCIDKVALAIENSMNPSNDNIEGTNEESDVPNIDDESEEI